METDSNANMRHALTWGLILGMVSILLTLLVYVINRELFASFTLAVISIAIMITILILSVTRRRKELGGYLRFGNAFMVCFVAVATGMLISSVFNYVMYNMIDPDLAEFVKQRVIDKTVAMM